MKSSEIKNQCQSTQKQFLAALRLSQPKGVSYLKAIEVVKIQKNI